MAEGDLLVFTIDGPASSNGAIPADVFTAKLNAFVATIYALERAYTKRDKRQLDLEVTGLSKSSPGQIKYRLRSKVNGYDPAPAVTWSFNQLAALASGRGVDPAVTQGALDNVVDLAQARRDRLANVGLMQATFGSLAVKLDDALAERAIEARNKKAADVAPLWRSGVSEGSVFGELRGVMDFEGDHTFYIAPPTGPARIKCVFGQALRAKMQENLFKVVKAYGYLHYDGQSPFPHLLEASRLDGIDPPSEHFLELQGLFAGAAAPA